MNNKQGNMFEKQLLTNILPLPRIRPSIALLS